MSANGATVLVAGATEDRVDRLASHLAGSVEVRTTVGTTDPSTEVDVVLYADDSSLEEPSPPFSTDARRVVVIESADEFDRLSEHEFDRVLVEPLVPDTLRATIERLTRQVRYDRRLRECAELAARCGRSSPNRRNGPEEPEQLRERVADAKAELDGLIAEFSTDDFRRAFETLAAD